MPRTFRDYLFIVWLLVVMSAVFQNQADYGFRIMSLSLCVSIIVSMFLVSEIKDLMKKKENKNDRYKVTERFDDYCANNRIYHYKEAFFHSLMAKYGNQANTIGKDVWESHWKDVFFPEVLENLKGK